MWRVLWSDRGDLDFKRAVSFLLAALFAFGGEMLGGIEFFCGGWYYSVVNFI